MNYSEDPVYCRVDFWKPTGKWYKEGLKDSDSFRWIIRG